MKINENFNPIFPSDSALENFMRQVNNFDVDVDHSYKLVTLRNKNENSLLYAAFWQTQEYRLLYADKYCDTWLAGINCRKLLRYYAENLPGILIGKSHDCYLFPLANMQQEKYKLVYVLALLACVDVIFYENKNTCDNED